MNRVKEWLEIAKVEPSEKNARLYIELIKEEFNELMDAWEDGDFPGIVDGGEDLKWVTNGLLIVLGVDTEKSEKEVADSNFSKFEDDKVIATGSVQGFDIPSYLDEVEHEGKTLYIIRRKSDNKILKPATYKKPDWGWLTPPEWM